MPNPRKTAAKNGGTPKAPGGEYRRVEVKIVDALGIESLKIVHVEKYGEFVALMKAEKH